MMSHHHIFIAHSSKDINSARKICELLERAGLSCWIAPRNVRPGFNYDEEIVEGIESSRVMVVLLSENSNQSQHVKRELEIAMNQGNPIFPIRIQNVLPGRKLKFYLAGKHWVDAWEPPLEEKIESVAREVKAIIDEENKAGEILPEIKIKKEEYDTENRSASLRGSTRANGLGANINPGSTSYAGFISYRREGGADRARLILDKIKALTGQSLFLDVEDLSAGRFDDKLLDVIAQTKNFIVVLTNGSLDRCTSKGDWFGREILHAMRTNRQIIPVMSEGFVFPTGSKLRSLPKEFGDFHNYNAVNWSHVNINDTIRKIADFMAAPKDDKLWLKKTEEHLRHNDIQEPVGQNKKGPAVLESDTKQRNDSVSSDPQSPPPMPIHPAPQKTSKKISMTVAVILTVAGLVSLLVIYGIKSRDTSETVKEPAAPDTSVSVAPGDFKKAGTGKEEILNKDSTITAAETRSDEPASATATTSVVNREKDSNTAYYKAAQYERSDPASAVQKFEQNTAHFPHDYRNFLKVGLYYTTQKGSAAKGVTYLEKCVTLADTVSDAWLTLGFAYAQMNRNRDMLNAFRRYIQLDQQNVTAIFRIGQTLLDKKMIDDAMVFLEMANAISENDPKIMTLLARGFVMTRRSGEAVKIIEKIIKVTSGTIDDDLRVVRIDCNLEEGNNSTAIDDINYLMKKKRTNPLLLKYAKAHYVTSNFPEALNAIEEIKATEPENLNAIMLLGRIQVAQKKYNEAVETFKEAIYINQYYAPAMVERAEVYFIQGKYPWAKTFYERALNVDSKIARAHLGLALVARQREDMQTYKVEVATARKLDPADQKIEKEYRNSLQSSSESSAVSSAPAVKQETVTESAQKRSEEIYMLLGDNRVLEAVNKFNVLKSFLQTNLDEESFKNLKYTLEQMGGVVK